MQTRNNWERILAFSCTHCPEEDPEAVDWLCEQAAEFKPTIIVHLGDLHEMDSASRWPSEYSWTLMDEYRAADAMLKRIRLSGGKSVRKCLVLPGNHDDNIYELGRIDKKLREVCSWKSRRYDEDDVWVNEERYTNWKVGSEYVYCRRRGVWRCGQATFAHGYPAGQNADHELALTVGLPFGLTVSGHTHRPRHIQQAKAGTRETDYWFANAGCLRDMDPDYMKRKRKTGWGQGCVLVECDPRAANSKMTKITKEWSAETRIFRMYDEAFA